MDLLTLSEATNPVLWLGPSVHPSRVSRGALRCELGGKTHVTFVNLYHMSYYAIKPWTNYALGAHHPQLSG